MKKWSLFMVLLVNLLDIYTSLLSGGYEGNSWIRDDLGHPVLFHMIVVKLLFYVLYGVFLLVGYKQLKKISQKLADTLVVGACLYTCLHFVEVLIGNLVIHWNWVN